MTVVDRCQERFTREPSLDVLELYLLIGHYYFSAKATDTGELVWELCNRMVGLATALGLHRDPDKWNMSTEEVVRRRWAWWNVLTYERQIAYHHIASSTRLLTLLSYTF
jgi:hypothetical protein